MYMIENLETNWWKRFRKICACQFKYNYFFYLLLYSDYYVDEPTDLLPPYFEKKNIFPEHYKQQPKPLEKNKKEI